MDNDKIIIDALIKSNKFLREERDEARREVCHLSAEFDLTQNVISHVELIAEEYGWDCFKREEADHNNNHFRSNYK